MTIWTYSPAHPYHSIRNFVLLHGDAAIPLFRVFFAGMYAIFDVQDAYWNLYFLLLTLAVSS